MQHNAAVNVWDTYLNWVCEATLPAHVDAAPHVRISGNLCLLVLFFCATMCKFD